MFVGYETCKMPRGKRCVKRKMCRGRRETAPRPHPQGQAPARARVKGLVEKVPSDSRNIELLSLRAQRDAGGSGRWPGACSRARYGSDTRGMHAASSGLFTLTLSFTGFRLSPSCRPTPPPEKRGARAKSERALAHRYRYTVSACRASACSVRNICRPCGASPPSSVTARCRKH